jgi:hypothetical protein
MDQPRKERPLEPKGREQRKYSNDEGFTTATGRCDGKVRGAAVAGQEIKKHLQRVQRPFLLALHLDRSWPSIVRDEERVWQDSGQRVAKEKTLAGRATSPAGTLSKSAILDRSSWDRGSVGAGVRLAFSDCQCRRSPYAGLELAI